MAVGKERWRRRRRRGRGVKKRDLRHDERPTLFMIFSAVFSLFLQSSEATRTVGREDNKVSPNL